MGLFINYFSLSLYLYLSPLFCISLSMKLYLSLSFWHCHLYSSSRSLETCGRVDQMTRRQIGLLSSQLLSSATEYCIPRTPQHHLSPKPTNPPLLPSETRASYLSTQIMDLIFKLQVSLATASRHCLTCMAVGL